GELLLRLAGLTERKIELAKMLARAAMAAVERERLLIMLHGGPQLPQPVMRIPDVIVDIRVVRIAPGRKLERPDGGFPGCPRERLFASCEIRIEALDCIERCHGGANRPVFRHRCGLAGASGSAEPRRNQIPPRRLAEPISGAPRNRHAQDGSPCRGT